MLMNYCLLPSGASFFIGGPFEVYLAVGGILDLIEQTCKQRPAFGPMQVQYTIARLVCVHLVLGYCRWHLGAAFGQLCLTKNCLKHTSLVVARGATKPPADA